MKILFICLTNSTRSQMAEALLRARAGGRAEAFSAGIAPGSLHPLAVQVLEEVGVQVTGQEAKSIGQLEESMFDLVITLCNDAREACFSPDKTGEEEQKRLFSGVPIYLHWPVGEPADAGGGREEILGSFRTVRDLVGKRLADLVDYGYLDAFARERERLQLVVDIQQSGILIHDEQRRIFLVNNALLRITGRSRDDLIGRECQEVFPPRGLCGDNCSFCDGKGGVNGEIEYSLSFADARGRKKQLRVISRPLEMEPGKYGVVALVHDETEVSRLRTRLTRQKTFHNMVGVSPAIREVFGMIESVSQSDYPVLISGDSGTGKELVAAAIHRESGRRGGPFVPVNCGALPESILESELFGHVRGAFTGAIRDKKGRFELAGGGTLFLDEVGELTPPVQIKLLRVLQEKVIERVGGEKPVPVDVRIISATNRDLREMVGRNAFREDLFYRLCVVPMALPALRERREDIAPLVGHFLERISQETGREFLRVSDKALECLLNHHWPGNVRELINALQFAAVRSTGEVLRPEHLPPEVRFRPPTARSPLTPPPTGPADLQPASFPPTPRGQRVKLTMLLVEQAIEETGGNKVRAARLLGVGRATLYRFLDAQKAGPTG
jgi:PAS domain S-box-containing protein